MGSVLAYTITLQLGNLTKTYPIVIGTSRCDHNKVHQRVNEDLKIWVDKIKNAHFVVSNEDYIALDYFIKMGYDGTTLWYIAR